MPAEGTEPRRRADLRRRERIQELSPRDRIRVAFTLQGHDVVEIMVQLECEVDGAFRPCRRYDTSHGMFHVHPEAWRRQPNRREPVAVASLSDALTRAIVDLVEHYPTYRAQLEASYDEDDE